MTVATHSLVILCPAAYVSDANLFAWAMDWQLEPSVSARSFSVPLSADGLEPATYFGTHTWATSDVVKIFDDGKAGTLPDKNWIAYGLDAQRVADLFSVFLISAIEGLDATANWSAALASAGLMQIMPVLDYGSAAA